MGGDTQHVDNTRSSEMVAEQHETETVPANVARVALAKVRELAKGSQVLYRLAEVGTIQNILLENSSATGKLGARWVVKIITEFGHLNCGTVTVDVKNGVIEATSWEFRPYLRNQTK